MAEELRSKTEAVGLQWATFQVMRRTFASLAKQAGIAAVLELAPFERFVYVMSVLERYSDQDCSVLLGCMRRDVIAARTRALQQIGSAMQLRVEQLVNVGSRLVHKLQLAPSLASLA